MNNEKTLSDISYETKKVNNNLQRLCNIGLLGIFFKVLEDAREDGNEEVIMIGKIGLAFVAVSQAIILISDIVDVYKKKREDEDDSDEAELN